MYKDPIYHLLRRHKAALAAATALGLALLIISLVEGSRLKTSAFMLTILGCFLVSEFIYHSGKMNFPDWKIKAPRSEWRVVLFIQIVGLVLLVTAFVLIDRSTLARSWGMVLMALRIIFIFPVFLLVYFLAVRRYSLVDIGFRLRHAYVAFPLIILIGVVSFFGFPEGVQFADILQQHGYWSFLTLGFLTAALPEEILRNLFQSRLSAISGSKSLGWFLASLIWALSHIPSFGSQSGDYISATLGALGIMPIGLLWGYLNERYRSIVPAVLIHGTNLWGLQNIFS